MPVPVAQTVDAPLDGLPDRWMSWVLMHQTGSTGQARRLAVGEADRIEPRLGTAKPEQISVWGGLLLSGAVAAGRDDQPAEADDLLNVAEAAATRLQAASHEVRLDHDRPFGLPVVVHPFLLLFFIEALSRLSQRRWELLQEPRVAIGITKPGKLHLTKIDHLVHLDTTLYESLASLVDVVYHQVQAMNRSRLHI